MTQTSFFAEFLFFSSQRLNTSFNRNPAYVFTKLTTLLGLMTFLGTVYYKVMATLFCSPATGADNFSCENDLAGIQSAVSLIFLSGLNTGMVWRDRETGSKAAAERA
jgi:hypothetical protein